MNSNTSRFKRIRLAAILMFCVLVMVFLTGCSRGTCYGCQQEATLQKYVMRGVGNIDMKGKTVNLCEDCMRMYKLFGN